MNLIGIYVILGWCLMPSQPFASTSRYNQRIRTLTVAESSESGIIEESQSNQCTERANLKSELLYLCSTTDRGFGANSKDSDRVLNIISSLKYLSMEPIPTKGLHPNTDVENKSPLEGVWKLAFTTAYDVLSLASNPLTQLQGIYQVISSDGSSVNVIDLAPKIQTSLPILIANKLSSITRAKVFTYAYARTSNRVGLTFKRVELEQNSLLGVNIGEKLSDLGFPRPPRFGIDLPTFTLFGTNENASENSPGYFDVLYLDSDMLIIQQNQPGGVFVSLRDRFQSIEQFL